MIGPFTEASHAVCYSTITLRPPSRSDHGQRTNDMLIIDSHLDLAWNALDWNRDLLLPAEAIRRREREQKMTDKGRGEGTVSFPELRRGQVGVFIATLL